MKTPLKLRATHTIILVVAGLLVIVLSMRNLSLMQIIAAIGVSLTMTVIAWLVSIKSQKTTPIVSLSKSLPTGYYSWYKFYLDNIHGKTLRNNEVTVFDPRPAYINEKSGGTEMQTIQITKFDMEYVKARVMEEVINHIPSSRDECQMIIHGVSYIGPAKNEVDKIKDKMFQLLKLLSR